LDKQGTNHPLYMQQTRGKYIESKILTMSFGNIKDQIQSC